MAARVEKNASWLTYGGTHGGYKYGCLYKYGDRRGRNEKRDYSGTRTQDPELGSRNDSVANSCIALPKAYPSLPFDMKRAERGRGWVFLHDNVELPAMDTMATLPV